MAKLKSFLTKAGFYEMAVAAPSMAAALRAWGMTHNAFATGLAQITTDKRIVEATMAAPGVVLRRPIGSKGAFQENPDAVKAPRASKSAKTKKSAEKKNNAALARAEAALARAEATHDAIKAKLDKARAKLEQEEEAEAERWAKLRHMLENKAAKAKNRK